MTKGEVECINLKCTCCPFGGIGKLRHCTRFKLKETLFTGLAKNEEYLSPKDYYYVYDELNKEVLKGELVKYSQVGVIDNDK